MLNKKKNIIMLACFLGLIAVLSCIYLTFQEKTTLGSKNITIEVINQEGKTTSYTVKTDAEYLRQAMEKAEGLTFNGTEGPYGLMITEVNGQIADYMIDGAYWSFYVNGQYCNYSIDQQPIADQDIFQIIYTKG